MKVDSLSIQNIAGIKSLDLKFNEGLNLICGMNGVGKTTILECIVHSFSFFGTGQIKRNAKTDRGKWKITVEGIESTFETDSFSPSENNMDYTSLADGAMKVIYVKDQRQIVYQRLDGIKPDEVRDHNRYLRILVEGLKPDSIKTWFTNRVLFNALGKLSEAEQYNMNLAMECFSLLDKNVTYSTIDHISFDIMVNTPRGEIYFEYLSSGFKSALFILLGLIKEIEFNSNPKIKITEFNGVILIDEADTHLHPYWQGSFVDTLKSIFQQAQIIITTHSPHMIQEADSDELIALGIDDFGEVCILEVEQSEFGFKGWTIEEILEDVMGLKETRSNDYIRIKEEFESALNDEEIQKAKESYEILIKMLHPRSPMRKVYELQLGSLG